MSPPILSSQCAEIQMAIVRLRGLIADYNSAPSTPDPETVLHRKLGLKEAENELASLEAKWDAECAEKP